MTDLVLIVVAQMLIVAVSFGCGHVAGKRAERNRKG
jgi:hypothetical protein